MFFPSIERDGYTVRSSKIVPPLKQQRYKILVSIQIVAVRIRHETITYAQYNWSSIQPANILWRVWVTKNHVTTGKQVYHSAVLMRVSYNEEFDITPVAAERDGWSPNRQTDSNGTPHETTSRLTPNTFPRKQIAHVPVRLLECVPAGLCQIIVPCVL
jgi:hypothetical protein